MHTYLLTYFTHLLTYLLAYALAYVLTYLLTLRMYVFVLVADRLEPDTTECRISLAIDMPNARLNAHTNCTCV